MLDSIAKFATSDNSATYDSTTSTTFDHLFSCTKSDPGDNLMDQAHHVWQGMVEYARAGNSNDIVIKKANNLVSVLDNWGARCEHHEDPTIFDKCSVGGRWSECLAGSCVPADLRYTDSEGEVDIDIYEPCNFVSNLAYYRVMPQLCDSGDKFFMDQETSYALNHAFGGLAAGSALWHGSHTFLGQRADNTMIAATSFVIYQFLLGSILGALGFDATDESFRNLMDLSNTPRSRTAVQIANDVTSFITSQPISEWALEFQTLDLPSHDKIFGAYISTVLSVLFHDKPDFVGSVLSQLASFLGTDMTALEGYLPSLLSLGGQLDLADDTKFILFRQFIGMGGKMLFAFLWQERQLQMDSSNIFLEEDTNAHAPLLVPIVTSFFNFLTKFKHVDDNFQSFKGMFPGDEACRATQPHAKWHELSANALLDMVYLADCIGGLAGGSGTCAHMSSDYLSGKERMGKRSFKNWAKEELENLFTSHALDIPGLIKDSLGSDHVLDLAGDLLGEALFNLLDLDNAGTSNDQVDWDDVEDIADLVTWGIGFLEKVLRLYQNFCTDNNDCGSDKYCDILGLGGTPLQCQNKRNNGQTCLADSSCQADTCSVGFDTTSIIATECGVQCDKNSDCGDDEWCHKLFEPRICKPKKNKGYFPCLANGQCKNSKCSWWGECVADSAGNSCSSNSDCDIDEFCENNFGTNTCFKKLPRGHLCTRDKHCVSDRCRDKNILGVGQCKGSSQTKFCSDTVFECTVDMLNEYITDLCDGCSVQQLQNAIDEGLAFFTDFIDIPNF